MSKNFDKAKVLELEGIGPYFLIGLSVLMHVAWNLLARHVPEKSNFFWWALLTHLVLFGPIGFYALWLEVNWDSTLILMALTTMLANSLYFVGLRKAYSFAPTAYVYPLARSSPLLILLWSFLFFNESPSGMAFLGIVISVLGLWLLARTGKNEKATFKALPWILIATLSTSVYSISDKVAIGYLPGFMPLIGFVSLGYLASFFALSLVNVKQTGAFLPSARPKWIFIFVGGLFIGVAYALVIKSMQYLPAAYVVSFTNSGILLASFISIYFLKERTRWKERLSAAVVVGIGLVILGS